MKAAPPPHTHFYILVTWREKNPVLLFQLSTTIVMIEMMQFFFFNLIRFGWNKKFNQTHPFIVFDDLTSI
jgi:hypothetical protein